MKLEGNEFKKKIHILTQKVPLNIYGMIVPGLYLLKVPVDIYGLGKIGVRWVFCRRKKIDICMKSSGRCVCSNHDKTHKSP